MQGSFSSNSRSPRPKTGIDSVDFQDVSTQGASLDSLVRLSEWVVPKTQLGQKCQISPRTVKPSLNVHETSKSLSPKWYRPSTHHRPSLSVTPPITRLPPIISNDLHPLPPCARLFTYQTEHTPTLHAMQWLTQVITSPALNTLIRAPRPSCFPRPLDHCS